MDAWKYQIYLSVRDISRDLLLTMYVATKNMATQ